MKPQQRLKSLTEQGLAIQSDFPGFKPLMLATLTKEYFDYADWIYERKLDGIRCLLLKNGKKISLISRNAKELNATFPEICSQVSRLSDKNFIADGELVAFKGAVTSFSRIQDRLPIKNSPAEAPQSPKVFLYLFDLLYFDGYAIEEAPLLARKQLLRDGLSWGDPFRYSSYRRENGIKYLQSACAKGWEGLIAKDGKSKYTHGRSRDWQKFKCSNRQELVIGGFTEPEGDRAGFGALLVGFYKDGSFRYAGKVGTGFTDDFLLKWRKKLDGIQTEVSPFTDFSKNFSKNIHWVKPRYVGEFSFTEWTKNDRLRHPSFIGMRYDKDPTDITKETYT